MHVPTTKTSCKFSHSWFSTVWCLLQYVPCSCADTLCLRYTVHIVINEIRMYGRVWEWSTPRYTGFIEFTITVDDHFGGIPHFETHPYAYQINRERNNKHHAWFNFCTQLGDASSLVNMDQVSRTIKQQGSNCCKSQKPSTFWCFLSSLAYRKSHQGTCTQFICVL